MSAQCPLALRPPPGERSPLVAGKLWLSTKNYTPRFRTLAPLAGPCPDQFALEFGETAQNGQHQAAMEALWRCPRLRRRPPCCLRSRCDAENGPSTSQSQSVRRATSPDRCDAMYSPDRIGYRGTTHCLVARASAHPTLRAAPSCAALAVVHVDEREV